MISFIICGMALSVLMSMAVGRSLESGIWEGLVTFGRAGSSFRPCGSREIWWVKSQGLSRTAEELETRYADYVAQPYEPVYVRIKGDVSRKGQYGPLGSYQRVLYVEEVLEIRAASERDCE